MPDPGPVIIPERKSPLAVNGIRLLLCLFVYWLDIGMFIISIMAYKGAQSDDSREILRRTFITFSPAGHHIQRTEIALVNLPLAEVDPHQALM